MGVSGSGKTTSGRLLAEDFGWTFSDGDTLHSQANLDKLRQGIPLTDEDRGPWLTKLRRAIARWMEEGRHVVLACSALKADFRQALLAGCEDRIRVVLLKGSFSLIEQRLAQREGHFMHRGLLAGQLETLQEPADTLAVDVGDSPERIVAQIRGF